MLRSPRPQAPQATLCAGAAPKINNKIVSSRSLLDFLDDLVLQKLQRAKMHRCDEPIKEKVENDATTRGKHLATRTRRDEVARPSKPPQAASRRPNDRYERRKVAEKRRRSGKTPSPRSKPLRNAPKSPIGHMRRRERARLRREQGLRSRLPAPSRRLLLRTRVRHASTRRRRFAPVELRRAVGSRV